MSRQIVYVDQVAEDTDILQSELNMMITAASIIQTVLGTSTSFAGLPCSATAPASMNVTVGAGFAFSQQNVDNSPYGSIAANTTQQIMKVGAALSTQTFACPAPANVGQSVDYLIQGAFQEVDTSLFVLPYYNPDDPDSPFNGPANDGISQATQRATLCTVEVKTGTPAATGTQAIPAPDPGFTGLYSVTVAYGQTTIIQSNIAPIAGVPIITEHLQDKISQATGDARYLQIVNARTRLTANTTFYVSTTGSDANNGLAVGTPWLTLQHAYDTINNSYDLAGFTATIQLADGTYTSGLAAAGPNTGQIIINGNSVTPANVFLNVAGAHGVSIVGGTYFVTVQNLKASTSGSGWNNFCSFENATVVLLNIIQSTTNNFYMYIGERGIMIIGNQTWSGNANSAIAMDGNSLITQTGNPTITTVGTPGYNTTINVSDLSCALLYLINFTGSGATGARYFVGQNSLIGTNGGGANYFPGNSGGSQATGGEYV